MTWFQWIFGEFWNFIEIFATENIITEIYGTEINGK